MSLVRGDREERAAFAYVAGCDGAHSRGPGRPSALHFGGRDLRPALLRRRREAPGAPFIPTRTSPSTRGDFALRLPSRRGENERLIGYVPSGRETDPRFEDVRADAERLLGVAGREVNWFSTYQVHHRVAARFRDGRCFLLGDAGAPAQSRSAGRA